MNGFLLAKNCEVNNVNLDNPKIISFEDIKLYYSPLSKFENDKLFYEDEKKIVLLDGVIFNKSELLEKYRTIDWKNLFEITYYNNNKEFMNELRGSFCGIVVDKTNKSIFAFTNHSGEKTVYYTKTQELLLIANHNNVITDILRQNHIKYEPDIESCYELLITGSILHGKTPLKNIHRLTAGKYMIYEKDTCNEIRYHMFHNIPEHDLSLDECVEKLDILFRQAIKRIYSKNEEYGYKAECDLSGGLDSRMATWVAHDMGYKRILNVCYCQSGNIDHTTSKKISKDIGNDYFFLPMDGGDILLDVDEVVDKFGGQVVYCICTGANRAFKQIDTSNIGLSVTGLLGELHNAYLVEGSEHTPPKYMPYRKVTDVKLNIPKSYSDDYDNYEQMNLYEYCNLFIMTSATVRSQVCEITSPFIDKDFLEFSYKVPLKFRKDFLLTKTWMVKKYPEAAKYVWQTIRMPVNKSYYNQFYFPKAIDDCKQFVVRVINKLYSCLNIPLQISQKTEMNPFDLWYRTNKQIKPFYEEYFIQNINLITESKLRADIIRLFNSKAIFDKIYSINLLAVFKRYFNG